MVMACVMRVVFKFTVVFRTVERNQNPAAVTIKQYKKSLERVREREERERGERERETERTG